MPIGWQGNSVFNNEGAKQTAGAILFESAGEKKHHFQVRLPLTGRVHPSVGLWVCWSHPSIRWPLWAWLFVGWLFLICRGLWLIGNCFDVPSPATSPPHYNSYPIRQF